MKKGFTLIELMVVIVIIGILAAVAVPKMFGMSDKAKASEVGSAAGSWVKVQTAYILETSNVGDWEKIGFTGPGKTNGTDKNKSETNDFKYDGTEAGEVSAENTVKLNDCEKGKWKLKMDTDAKVTATIATITGNGCDVLTPSFKKLGEE